MKKSRSLLLFCALIVLVGAAPVALGITKWAQPPDPTVSGLHSHDDGDGSLWIKLADDFQCSGGDITTIRWYGNYENDFKGSGIASFHLSLHNNDTLPTPYLPLEPELVPPSIDAPFAQCNETDTGMTNGFEKIYSYEYVLPAPYPQVAGTWYWLDVMAKFNVPAEPIAWRWQEARRGPLPALGQAPSAERTQSTPWSSPSLPGGYSDMAFEIISGEPSIPTVTEWGMIVLGVLVLVCGAILIKRKLPKVA